MRWQRIARLAIAAFVIVFAGVVVFIMRQRSALPPAAAITVPTDEKTVVASTGPIEHTAYDRGRVRFSLKGKDHKIFAGGKMEIADVAVSVPDRENGMITITADRATVQSPPEKEKVNQLQSATFTGNVKLTNEKGVTVSANEATYEESTGVVTIPGPVKFGRGRMSGTGLGATYDKNRDVLWILDKAHVTVAPDAAGAGAAEANAGTIGMARSQNYIKMVKNASIVGDGRTASGDEVTAWLNEGGETLKSLEIRGNSRITGTGPNAQNMSARDIDLGYAPDGRTLQSAKLIENGVVELPGAAGAPARRITGKTIDLGMSPDGTTLTLLNANENVEVNLPPAGDAPAQRIRAAALSASGPAGAGLQTATFTGGATFTETRAARGALTAVDRTAHADRLILTTKPGLGDVEQADFRGHFRMQDNRGPAPAAPAANQRGAAPPSKDADARPITAEAPRGIYFLTKDSFELSPEGGDPGPTPFVNDGRMRVSARNIRISPSTQKLSADTNVQSTMQPQRRTETTSGGRAKPAASDGRQGNMPAILKEDKPVTVVAHRLEYDGKGEAVYTGKARLWQEQSKIDAETIILNDTTGNLTARTNVRSTMPLEDTDPKTKQTTITETTAESDTLVYDDTKRVAVYTGSKEKQAHMRGAQGDMTANRIDVFLTEDGGRLERAVAVDNVVVVEGIRRAFGQRLVYTASNETYTMTGAPVEAFEQESPNSCKVTQGETLTFKRAVGSIQAKTGDLLRAITKTLASPCPTERRD
jgi:lipopolysaccharide export system protein LptA